jgi:hypothetical protein
MAIYDLPGKTILMHNRMGVRIELNLDRVGLLELWISPRAGESLDYRDRNFSCRDDHTRLMDRIELPRLGAERFIRCEYDPFHSVIYFHEQTLHLVSAFDRPTVLMWFERPEWVDLKSDKADAPVARTDSLFEVKHPDRGKEFAFCVALGTGQGRFVHQLQIDEGRSTFARAELSRRQVMAISGELTNQPVRRWARDAARTTPATTLAGNEREIRQALRVGSFRLKGRAKLQRLLDINRRVLLAMQDASGAIRAALNRIYYLIWVRDGAIIECFHAHAGTREPVEKWAEFVLANPTVVEDERPRGRTFTMLANRRITKWEEDGVFYAIWSAFTAWTQSGEDRFVTGDNLALLEEAMKWLEDYCYDSSAGLMGRYHYCESPLPGSRGDGWDNAVGKPTGPARREYGGKSIRRSYDIYINLYSYASYVMLAAMKGPREGRRYLRKADRLADRMKDFFGRGLPAYGDLLADDGTHVPAGPYGLDITDYVWALSITPFVPEPWRMPAIREKLFANARRKPAGYFLAGYFSLLSSLDTDWFDEGTLLEAIEYAAAQCYRPGDYLPMPNTVVEMLDVPDGSGSHDVRPQAFSVGPWLATIVGLGLRRLPFGLAVRGTAALSEIREYAYRDHAIDVRFSGHGSIRCIMLNRKKLVGSLQVPEGLLRPGKNNISMTMGETDEDKPLLVSSTVRLQQVDASDEGLQYQLDAYGRNTLVFRNVAGRRIRVVDDRGRPATLRRKTVSGRTYVEFDGAGRFSAMIQ